MDTAGWLSPIAGFGSFEGNGRPATSARLDYPTSLAVQADGSILVGEGYRVRRIISGATEDEITGVAGFGTAYNQPPNDLGRPEFSGLSPNQVVLHPNGIAITPTGAIFVTDYWRVLKIETSTSSVTLTAGTGNQSSGDIHDPLDAVFEFVGSAVLGADGTMYLAEPHQIRRISPQGFMSVVAGDGFPRNPSAVIPTEIKAAEAAVNVDRLEAGPGYAVCGSTGLAISDSSTISWSAP